MEQMMKGCDGFYKDGRRCEQTLCHHRFVEHEEKESCKYGGMCKICNPVKQKPVKPKPSYTAELREKLKRNLGYPLSQAQKRYIELAIKAIVRLNRKHFGKG